MSLSTTSVSSFGSCLRKVLSSVSCSQKLSVGVNGGVKTNSVYVQLFDNRLALSLEGYVSMQWFTHRKETLKPVIFSLSKL